MSAIGERVLLVSGVCCATEERVLRKAMDGLAGPDGYRFNPLTAELRVREDLERGSVERVLRRSGFAARPRHAAAGEERSFLRRHAAGLVTAGAALLAGGGLLMEYTGEVAGARTLLLAAVLGGGWPIARKALGALHTGTLDMHVLMTVAVTGALAIGRWGEAAAVVVLFSLALMLESYSALRTRRAIRSLLADSPAQGAVVRNGRELLIPAADIAPGEILLVRPGERIALDGIVTEGTSRVNEAPITGESRPVRKNPGDAVFAGALNDRGFLRIRVTARHSDTTLARIVQGIENAAAHRAPVQGAVERFARVYTPAVFVVALGIAVAPPLLMGASFADWFYRALVLLVIACPCALVISTPVTIVSALANAARHGVLVKGGRHLEALAAVTAVAFDKTGTLTEGRARVTEIVPLGAVSADEALAIAAALEEPSEHPVAEALVAEAARRNVPRLQVEQFEAHPGLGVEGTIGGALCRIGTPRFAAPEPAGTAAELLRASGADGSTGVVLARNGEPLAAFTLNDGPRSHGRRMVEALRGLGVQQVSIVSGDGHRAAAALATELGIADVHAGLLPEEKTARIAELRDRHGAVAMVGEGINDAPALAAATVGIAMGVGGTDAALESSDVVLMSDDLWRLPFLFALARRSMRLIRQNIALALGMKMLFLLLTFTGHATLWLALVADDGAALLVILNGLRAFTFRDGT